MFCIAIALILLADPQSPPERPAERPWPGGKWTGYDADEGKEFPKGAFLYTPRAEYEAWVKACHKWLLVNKPSVKFEAYGIPSALKSMNYHAIGGSPSAWANGPLQAYGGSGSISVIRSCPSGLEVGIVLKDVDFEKMSDGLAMQIPIRVTGTVGRLAGTILDGKGQFVGTEVQARGATIRRLDLTVDYATGLYTATADTNFGRQTIRGRLRESK